MGQGFYRQIVEALKAAGCEYRRQGKGDHEIWYSPITDRTFAAIGAPCLVIRPMP